MSFQNVIIKEVAIHHPDKEVGNQFYIDHFKKKNIDITGLFNHLGRDKRYHISNPNEENSLTMATKAAKKVLNQGKIKASEIDMIVFVSDSPEYLMPSNALMLHHKLAAVNAHITYDMNGNCIGMLTAIDQISRYLQSNRKIKRALVTGSIMPSFYGRNDDTVYYPTVGDGASAIVLESVEDEKKAGFIDSDFYVDSTMCEKILFPACGMSKILDENINTYEKKVSWIPHDVSYFSDQWKKLINKILDRNNVKVSDVEHFLFSQFSKADIMATLDKLDISHEKATFVADRYGYVGCSSPIFALNQAYKEKKILKNKPIVFCSVGSGFSMSAILYYT